MICIEINDTLLYILCSILVAHFYMVMVYSEVSGLSW